MSRKPGTSVRRRNINKIWFGIITMCFFLTYSGCLTLVTGDALTTPREDEQQYKAVKVKLLSGAEAVLGTKPMNINGKKFNMDCIGTVLAIYYYAGIDLTRDFHKYSGNGVSILYKILQEQNLTYDTKHPRPGDIIFFDNTWDANGDGKWNDPLTHVGMVVKAEENGNLEYIHYNYSKGNVYAKMSLTNPDTYSQIIDGCTVIINDAMRMKVAGKPRPSKWLSSHLYKIFAKGYLLKGEDDG